MVPLIAFDVRCELPGESDEAPEIVMVSFARKDRKEEEWGWFLPDSGYGYTFQ